MFSFGCVVHQGRERKEINLCLATSFIDLHLRIEITFHVKILRTLSDAVDVDSDIKQVGKYFLNFFIFLMSSFVCESIHQSHELLNYRSRERKEINLCLAALLCDQHLPNREWRCKDIDQVLLHGRCFLSGAFSGLPDQNSSLSKLPTTAC